MNKDFLEPSSFRDPSGFVFYSNGEVYRQINNAYKENYDLLINSGLYKKLTEKGLLVLHEEVKSEVSSCYKIIKPEKINFISYPYEWCFSQLKDAALITLKIQKLALEYGMSLKDASAYNIQFKGYEPVFIDTLSFEKYEEGKPWVAYRQFCQHFLAPLAVMAYRDVRLNKLLAVNIDGIPLNLASALLPFSSKLNFSMLTHIHLHAKSQKYYSDKVNKKESAQKLSRNMLLGIISSLESAVNTLILNNNKSEWGNYYEITNYSSTAFENKKKIVADYIESVKPKTLWDIAGNNGEFARIAAEKGINTVCFDYDYNAIEQCYKKTTENKTKHLTSLIMDLTNPSAGIGWENNERASFEKRGPADMVLALAVVHHLAISNNVPFVKIASFFSKISKTLVIEFVPKTDTQAQKLLAARQDIFENYARENFEREFAKYFIIEKNMTVEGSSRVIYLMRKANEQ